MHMASLGHRDLLAANVSQRVLARQLGCSRALVREWLAQRCVPNEAHQRALQRVLGIKPARWLLSAEEPAAVTTAAAEPEQQQPKPAPEPTEAPTPPWPPHESGPHRLPGESFRQAVERRELFRIEWQRQWLENWHAAHPNVPRADSPLWMPPQRQVAR